MVNKANREDLEKYFRYIFICRSCKKEFGADKLRKHLNELCPICDFKDSRNWRGYVDDK